MAVEIISDFSAADMLQYRKESLDFLRVNLPFMQACLPATLSKHSGKNVQAWRIGTLAAATTPLTEGSVPSTNNISSSLFSATLAQYGNVTQYSDMLELVGPGSFAMQGAKVHGYNAALTLNTLILTEFESGATLIYANNTDANTFDATSIMSGKEIRRATKRFRAKNVPGFIEDGLFRFYIHPDCEFDIVTDDNYGSLTDLQKRDPDPIKWKNISAVYGGCAIYQSSLIGTTTVGTTTAYKNIVVGYGAQIAYDLSGMPLQVFNSPPSNINQANPIGQIGALGWKIAFVTDNIGSDGPRSYQVRAAATEPTA